jgi:hypothetical protein
VTWSKVEAGQKAYDNVPNGVFHAAAIDWVETAWKTAVWSVTADVTPVLRAGAASELAIGTMRYRVQARLADGTVLRSMSPSSDRPGGPKETEDARKVSIRSDDTYLGYMSELANLPYIFGSTALGNEAHQAERAIGVDCADLMIYGLRRMGVDQEYLSSRTLDPISAHVAAAVRMDALGRYRDGGGKVIAVGEGAVRPGDWIIFSGHVGAFVEDRGVPGILDRSDVLMHIAWKELAIESLEDSGYGEAAFEVRRASALSTAP